MSVMFVLLPVALLFSAVALVVFILAARAGQFDDLQTPGLRILHDDDSTPPSAPRADVPPAPRPPA
jgi:cbb3-type cytochrome oxidase maturation protein